MSTLHNQPVVEDIVSAFETTQNQSWSIFSEKLGGIPIKDCKKKDIFKSKNPIELLDEDIPIFGLVPRLEKLVLVSCKKCLMIVKKDCIHYHYNRHHSNPENDNFSLESFMIPSEKINKYKKQKINIRNVRGKKGLDSPSSENVDPIVMKPEFVVQGIKSEFGVQAIKSEFGKLEFMRLPETSQIQIKQENEIHYDDHCGVNVTIQSCNSITDNDVFDWAVKPCTQNVVDFTDHKIGDRITVTKPDKAFGKISSISPDTKEENLNNTSSNVMNVKNTVNSFITSNESLSTSLNLKEDTIPLPTIDFADIMRGGKNDKSNNFPENGYYQLNSELQINEEQIKFTSSDESSNVRSDHMSGDFIGRSHQSFHHVDVKEETKLTPINNFSGVLSNINNIKIKNDIIEDDLNYYQLVNDIEDNKEHVKYVPSQEYSDVTDEKISNISDISNSKSSIISADVQEQTKNMLKGDFLGDVDNESFENIEKKSYNVSFELQNNKEFIELIPNKNYSDVPSGTDIKNKDCALLLQYNEEHTKYTSEIKFSDTTSSQCFKDDVNSYDQLSVVSMVNKEETQLKLTNEYSIVMNNETSDDTVTNYDESSNSSLDIKVESEPVVIIDYSCDAKEDDKFGKEYFQVSSDLHNNETLIALKPRYKCSNIAINEDNYNYELECHQLPSKVQDYKKRTQFVSSNNYVQMLMNNTNSNYSATSYCQSPNESTYSQEEITLAPSNEYSDVVNIESCGNTGNIYNNSVIQHDHSLSIPTDNKEETNPIVIVDYVDVFIHGNEDIDNSKNKCQISDLDDNKLELNVFSSYNYLDVVSESSNDSVSNYSPTLSNYNSDTSVTGSDQPSAESKAVVKETKCTQTDLFLNHENRKKTKNDTTMIDGSLADSLGIISDHTKCTQTEISLDCMNCCTTSKHFLHSYVPVYSNIQIAKGFKNSYATASSSAQISNYSVNNTIPVSSSAQTAEYSMHSFIPINSSAQIINNTFTPTSSKDSRLFDSEKFNHNTSSSSHYVSCSQQSSENLNLTNRLTNSTTVKCRRLEKNEKIFNSESLTDRSKPNELILNLNAISGLSYMDNNHVTGKSRFMKATDEKIVYGKLCKTVPYDYDNIEVKMKKSLKRRSGEQAADGKENRNRWIIDYDGFKKLKRMEFVGRKITCSDDSDNNDNVDE